jgi:hypothetical protein
VFLSNEGIVDLGVFRFCVEVHLHNIFLIVNGLNFSNQSIEFREKTNEGLTLMKAIEGRVNPWSYVHVVLVLSFLAEQTEGQDIDLLIISLVVSVLIGIVFDSLNTITGDKDVSSILRTEDTGLHQIMAHSIKFYHPLAFISVLLFLADLKLVRVSVTVESIHGELIFKKHGEGLNLVREINVNALGHGFGNLIHEFFKLLGLTLLNGLRNFNHDYVKVPLINYHRVVFNFSDIQVFERRKPWAWGLNSVQYLRFKREFTDLSVIFIEGSLTHVCLKRSQVSKS